jgi:mono/diheme cytochrome c family protein
MRRAIPSSVCLLALTLCACGSSSTGTRSTAARPALGEKELIEHTFFPKNPPALSVEPPPAVVRAGGRSLAEYKFGRLVTMQSGCLACHRIAGVGNTGPGPDLTEVAGRLPRAAIERSIIHATPPMPSFTRLPPAKFRALVAFLSMLR